MTRTQAILDLETTGLEYSRHQIWEAAVIIRDPITAAREEHLWRLEPDLAKADPAALRVGKFYERTGKMKTRDTLAHDIARTPANRGAYWSHPPALAALLARLLDDVTLVASNPVFDVGFLTAFLRTHRQAPSWHYRVKDFPSIAYGFLSGRPDRATPVPALDAGTDDFAMALGLDRSSYERHTALGDCRLVADGLDIIEGRLA